MIRSAVAAILFTAVGVSACANKQDTGTFEAGWDALALTSVGPSVLVPGSTLVVSGQGFLDEHYGRLFLHFEGTLDGVAVDAEYPATFIDIDRLEIAADEADIAAAAGDFVGEAEVIFEGLDGIRHRSPPLAVNLHVEPQLRPTLNEVPTEGQIYVNDVLEVSAEGLLLGGAEGQTFAVVTGCFQPATETMCIDIDPVQVPVTAKDPLERTSGSFEFSPRIAGIRPGHFEGRVYLRNEPQAGTPLESDAALVAYDIIPAALTTARTSDGTGASLGQYIHIEGGGFVGGDDGYTLLRIRGVYTPTGSSMGADVEFELAPGYVSGRHLRYVVNEDEDELGRSLDLRSETGSFEGTMEPIVHFGDDEVVGPRTRLVFSILPVKQVVYVRFLPSYVQSLRLFGLRALDDMVRERVLTVLRRDYDTINLEVRTEEPDDFRDYALVDVAGINANGGTLFGLDNTPGKDTNNKRLYDHIGGVSAVTQPDERPGYGGVFIESMFVFSKHPLEGKVSKVANELFDQVFDPFRLDTGTPVGSADLVDGPIPQLTSGAGCPAPDGDRRVQAACAVWVLGNLIGGTLSHENAHALGLANPFGGDAHNFGDEPNRLMDAGGNRPFEERTELMGQGPGVFCTDEYRYLRTILPTKWPDSTVERPGC